MKNNLIYVSLACGLLLSSCVIRPVKHYVYAPVCPQTPMFGKKGESDITATYATGKVFDSDSNYNRGPDVQAAYAVGDHLAVTGAWSYRREMNTYDNRKTLFGVSMPVAVWYRRNTWSLGMGYFTALGNSTVYFDLYGGYGFGTYRMFEHGVDTGGIYNHYHSTGIHQFYLQPGFHFGKPSAACQLALTFRLNVAAYHDIRSDYSPVQEDSFRLAPIRTTSYVYLEPALTFKFGSPDVPWIRGFVQMSFSGNLTDNPLYRRTGNLSAGLSFDLSKIGIQAQAGKKHRDNKTNNR